MRTVGIVGWVIIVTAFLVWQGFALVYTPTWPTMSEIFRIGDAAAPRAVDRVRGMALDRVAPVRARLELLPAIVMVPAGEIWRRIVPPLVTTFVVFLLLVRYHVRHADPAEPVAVASLRGPRSSATWP